MSSGFRSHVKTALSAPSLREVGLDLASAPDKAEWLLRKKRADKRGGKEVSEDGDLPPLCVFYEVPADNRIEASDRLVEAMALGVEEEYHVKDVVREPDAGNHLRVSLRPTRAGARCC